MNKPNKIYFTYEENAAGELKINRVFINYENRITQEDFDPERHLEMFSQFFKDNGIEGPDLIAEAEEKGIFARFNEKEVNKETVDKFLGVEEVAIPSEEIEIAKETPENAYALDDDENYLEDDEELEEDNKLLKRAAIGTLAAVSVAGMLVGLHSCSEQQIDEAKQENEDDIYKNMTEEQKEFFEETFNAVEEFNAKTTKDGNFKLDEDKSTLHLTVDEAVALRVMLNDYSADELYSIFGTLEFDTNNMMTLARSAYSKLSTYYMNAKEASGLSQLINDETARAFFERHENAVIEFNNNPSTELSDKVIKGLYYDYVHGGSTGEYAKIGNDGVAWLSTSAGFGFELANRNMPEYLKVNSVSAEEKAQYGDAVIENGMKLSKITTSDLLTGINEEIDLDILDEIDNKSLCAAVTTQTRDKVDALQMKQQIAATIVTANAKESLVEGLKNSGANSLANKVIASDVNLSQELLDEIRAYNSSTSQLVEDYNGRISSINSTEAKIVAILEIAQDKFGLDSEIDLPDLINNRFRTIEKVKEQQDNKNDIPTVDKDKFNSMSKEEQKEYIKDNGKVIGTTTTTTEVKVDKEDLTDKEKEDVASQEKVLKEVEQFKNKMITKGVNDAVAYTDEAGAYDYSRTIINPYNNQKIDTDNMSLFNIVAHATAFGDGANINSNDSQVKTRINKDAEKVTSEINSLSTEAKEYLQKEYGSDWKEQLINETYKDGYSKQVDGSLKKAKEVGVQLKASAKEAYEKAQAEADKKNEQTSSTTITPTPDVNDPNLDPNYGQEDEIPYVAKGVEEPVYYLSDEAWEAAYGNTTSEEATVSKTK